MEEFVYRDLPWIVAHLWVFAFGAAVGSFLNVCIVRLPWEKSVLWPGSHCFTCLTPIRTRDNLPIISYLLLRGKCRNCGAKFSSRYMCIEIFTGLAFALILYVDVYLNIHHMGGLERTGFNKPLLIGWEGWAVFAQRATLASLLIVASVADLDTRRIPLSLTTTGTLVGLLFSTLLAWPYPNELSSLNGLPADSWANFKAIGKVPEGVMPMPFWGPPPERCPPGSWQLGMMNGLVGAAFGSLMLRGVKFVFEKGFGREALGIGDADLMMMAGAFAGWQIVGVGFFMGAICALALMIPIKLIKRDGEAAMPFGPGLALGTWLTLELWPRFGPPLQFYLYDGFMLGAVVVILALSLFLSSVLLRRRGGYENRHR